MKNSKVNIFLISIILLMTVSCGGVIGNIKKYEFKNKTEDDLKIAIQNVYLKYPTLVKTDTVLYSHDSSAFFFIFRNNDDTIAFKCNIIPPMAGIGTELSLTSATKYGEILDVASNISYFKKRKYIRKFEENILPKIKAEL